MMTLRTHDNGVDRNMTADELAAYETLTAQVQAANVAAQQAATDKAAAAASGRAKLAALGLTDDEINALLGA